MNAKLRHRNLEGRKLYRAPFYRNLPRWQHLHRMMSSGADAGFQNVLIRGKDGSMRLFHYTAD